MPQAAANSNPKVCQDDMELRNTSDTDDSWNLSLERSWQADYLDYDQDDTVTKETRPQEGYDRRRMLGEFSVIEGNQLSDVSYCDKRKYYIGEYAHCFTTMTNFFARDVKLLHQHQRGGTALQNN